MFCQKFFLSEIKELDLVFMWFQPWINLEAIWLRKLTYSEGQSGLSIFTQLDSFLWEHIRSFLYRDKPTLFAALDLVSLVRYRRTCRKNCAKIGASECITKIVAMATFTWYILWKGNDKHWLIFLNTFSKSNYVAKICIE